MAAAVLGLLLARRLAPTTEYIAIDGWVNHQYPMEICMMMVDDHTTDSLLDSSIWMGCCRIVDSLMLQRDELDTSGLAYELVLVGNQYQPYMLGTCI